jgi:glutamate 5-kinase
MQTILTYHARREPALLEQAVENSWREPIVQAKNILIKAGTEAVTLKRKRLDMVVISNLFQNMADFIPLGYRFTLISSGAGALGEITLGEERVHKLTGYERGSIYSSGQSKLMRVYSDMHENYFGIDAASQILVDKYCFLGNRKEVTKGTLDGNYKNGCVSIINANDPTWPYETQAMENGSDNDVISKQVYGLIKADLLITLTDVPGFMDGFGTESERKIDLVTEVMKRTYALAKDANGKISRGGMQSKLQVGKWLIERDLQQASSQEKVYQCVIAHAKKPDILAKILSGENYGTWFTAEKRIRTYFT